MAKKKKTTKKKKKQTKRQNHQETHTFRNKLLIFYKGCVVQR